MEFSPMHLWESMTWIAKGVAITLVILSVYSLYVTLERYLFFKKAKSQSLDFAKQATAALAKDQIQQAVDVARKFPASHLARVTRAGLIEFQLDNVRSSGLSGSDLVEAARRAIERETLITYSDFKKGVGALATIATTAPFIGLFGTVIGIINAFRGMSSGAGGIADVQLLHRRAGALQRRDVELVVRARRLLHQEARRQRCSWGPRLTFQGRARTTSSRISTSPRSSMSVW